MIIEDIQFYTTAEGLELIEKYKDLSDDDLEMLTFSLAKKGVPHYPYLITLLKLRKKARTKFSKADEMFFDSPTLEMATSEKIARHIAERFIGMKKVVDLTCGIGGNAIFLAKNSKVLAVDLDKTSIEMAKLNSIAYGVNDNIEFRVGNAHFNIDEDADAFFLDPMRSREGDTKTRSFMNTQPKVLEMLAKIFKITENVCIKVSPAFDYKEIDLFPQKPEIEIVSENNENKVALLWFGEFRQNKRKATIFIGNDKKEIINCDEDIQAPINDKPETYIYEPNKAIIKAHLIDEIAKEHGLSKINKNIAFLTKNSLINEARDKFRIFKVLRYKPFSLKILKRDLREEGIENLSVINRGTPILPEKLIKDLKIKEGSDAFVLVTKLKDDKNYYIITKKVAVC
ncbi:MAG: methyltransferase [Patescibacteria group bacterium]|jgi:SAM-dependent methyltransferase|nr:methyltransferase [Patescibacteria group bacterium]